MGSLEAACNACTVQLGEPAGFSCGNQEQMENMIAERRVVSEGCSEVGSLHCIVLTPHIVWPRVSNAKPESAYLKVSAEVIMSIIFL